MSIEVTLQLPKSIYFQACLMAKAEDERVEDILIEHLEWAFGSAEVDEKVIAMQREEEAYEKLEPYLLTIHRGQYVALFQGQVVDTDQEEESLLARLMRNYPDEVVLVRQVTGQPSSELHFPARRLMAVQ